MKCEQGGGGGKRKDAHGQRVASRHVAGSERAGEEEMSTAWFANAFIAKAAGETMEYAWAARARKQ